MQSARLLGLLGASILLAACSSANVGHEPTAAATLASPASPAATRDSSPDAVTAYIDSLYDHTAVRHSFVTGRGDTVDCVDFAAEPGVRALVAQGAKVDSVLASMNERTAAHGAVPAPAPAADVGLDEAGNLRACPEGTAPHVRLTREKIAAAGGLDAYRATIHAHRAPQPDGAAIPLSTKTDDLEPATNPTSGGLESGDSTDYGHVYSYQTASFVAGGASTMAIGPDSIVSGSFINDPGNHSLAQIWIVGGSGSTLQTLEIGWEYDATNGGPYFFVAMSQNDYGNYCENGQSSITSTGPCVPWTPNPSSTTIYPGAFLPASVTGGVQHELSVQVIEECVFSIIVGMSTCSWDVFAGVNTSSLTLIGSVYNGGYGKGPLGTEGATIFETGGEVYDGSGTFADVSMGEGSMLYGGASYGSTAYVRNFGYYPNDCIINRIGGPACPGSPVQTPATVYTTRSQYDYNTTAAAGSSSWTNWFYYGDYWSLIVFRG